MSGKASNTISCCAAIRGFAPSGSPRSAVRCRARSSIRAASRHSNAAPSTTARRKRRRLKRAVEERRATMANPAPGYATKPEHRVDLLPDTRRLRVTFAGTVIADSSATLRVEETGHAPVHYFPEKDVQLDLLRP